MINKAIEKYVEDHSTEEPEVLKKLNRKTYSDVLKPHMLSGHVQGRFLSMISKLIRPFRILEIGTFTGYSALCLAEGLEEKGQLITIDLNEELEGLVRSFIDEAGLTDKIIYKVGDALKIIPELENEFDLIFLDADKVNYEKYYLMCFPKLKVGGILLADNVLWKGRITDQNDNSRDLSALRKFNDMIQQDDRVENLIISMRDGLLMARKIKN